MEIAGSTCAVCAEHIVLMCEGKSCPTCRIVVHRTCEPHSICPRCEAQYEIPEPPGADVFRDAILPRSLRPSRGTSPVALVIFAAVALLVGVAFLVFVIHPHR